MFRGDGVSFYNTSVKRLTDNPGTAGCTGVSEGTGQEGCFQTVRQTLMYRKVKKGFTTRH